MPPFQSTMKLNDGHDMPCLGFGTGQLNEATNTVLRDAIAAGYRLIDTAARYNNEERVGDVVSDVDVPREALSITTKVWPDRFGFAETLRAFDGSLARLRLDRVDLYLLHWPAPWLDRYVESWRALIKLREEGKATSVGVANFDATQIQRLADETGELPAVNQVELHPHFQQTALRAFHAQNGIATQAWSPLGQARILGDPVLVTLGKKHGKAPSQIVLRWHYQSGIVPIPKSANPQRIRSNIDISDFELSQEDMAAIAACDRPDGRIGAHPEQFPR